MAEEKKPTTEIALAQVSEKFALVCSQIDAVQIAQNAEAAFKMVGVLSSLESILSDSIMKQVFMPLQNRRVGFLTDHNGKQAKDGTIKAPYEISVVRDCLIDALMIGLLPTGNQFNIIANNMYVTKEGFTSLLKKMNVKCFFNVGADKSTVPTYAEVPVLINYEYKGEKKSFSVVTTVKKDSYSSMDLIRGKAERRAKKSLYEYLTGITIPETDDELTDMASRPEQPIGTKRDVFAGKTQEAEIVHEKNEKPKTGKQGELM